MKVYVNLALSHERPGHEDAAGVVHHSIDVVNVPGVGDDEAEAFQSAWHEAGQVPLEENMTYTVTWARVEPPAPITDEPVGGTAMLTE